MKRTNPSENIVSGLRPSEAPDPSSFPPRFEPRRLIGEGASGLVYEVRDRSLGIPVALKVLRHVSPKTLTRFKREARSFSEIAHENLVDVHGLYEHEGRWFMAMELVQGTDLVQACGLASRSIAKASFEPTASLSHADFDEAPLPPKQDAVAFDLTGPGPFVDFAKVRELFAQLLDALAALGRAGIVHRDIKPSNVLVAAPSGRLVVLDLGLALVLRDDAAYGMAGTPSYASPEQLAGEPIDDRSDVYAAGTMLYEILTGRLPYRPEEGGTLGSRKKQWDPPSIASLRPETPLDLVELCEAMLTRQVQERPRAEVFLEKTAWAKPRPHARRENLRSRFVGRKAELSVLHASLERALAGYATTVVVRGKSGIGKTTLLRHFLESQDSPTQLVLTGRCYANERAAFRGFEGIIESLCAGATLDEPLRNVLAEVGPPGDLVRMFPVLASFFPGDVASMADLDARERRSSATRVLQRLFEVLAERYSLILSIDDVQWLDRDGFELLRAVLGGPLKAPLLLLLGMRVDESVDPETVTRLLALFPSAKEVVVGQLSHEECRDLAQSLSGWSSDEADDAMKGAIDECGGDPLLLEEILSRREEGSNGARSQTDFVSMLLSRARRLSAIELRLAELLALAERPLSREILFSASKLGGFTMTDIAEGLRALRAMRLVRTIERNGEDCLDLFHDRVRDALLYRPDWSAESRKETHAALAQALELQGAATHDPSQLVKHLLEAGERVRAAVLSREAARRASEMLAFDRAVELLRYAARAENSGPSEELAKALAAAGLGCESADAYLELSKTASPADKSRYMQLAAEQLLTGGDLERGLLTLKDVLRDVGERLPHTRAEAFASIALQRIRAKLPSSFVLRRGTEAERKRKFDALRTVAFGLGMIDNFSAAACHAKAYVLAYQLDELPARGEVIATEAIFRGSTSTEARGRARALIVEARRIADVTGSESVAAWAEGADAILGVYDSIAGDAIDRLERAARAFHGGITCAGWARSSLYLIRALSLRMAGQFRRLARVAESGLADAAARRDRYLEVTLRRGGVAVQLAADDVARARSDLATARWTPWRQGFHIQHWLEVEGESELALYEGSVETAMRTLEPSLRAMRRSLVARLQRVRVLSDGLVGRLLLARAVTRGFDRGARHEVARLSDRLDAENATDATAHAACLRAGAHYLRGDHAAAKEALLRAVRDADTSGLRALAACARLRLVELDRLHSKEHDAKAAAYFVEEGVVRPSRFANVYVPGWPHHGA